MLGKIFLNIALIISLASCQIALVPSLPGFFRDLNIIIVVLVFIIMVLDIETAAYWALATGFIMDIFSFLPFGSNIINLLFLVFVGYLLTNYVLTNRSLYSFLAVIFSLVVINNVVLTIIDFLLTFHETADGSFLIISSSFWHETLIGIILDFFLTTIVFYFFHYISKRLKPVFIIQRSKRLNF